MNKYLEKIAASMKVMKAARNGMDGYQLKGAIDKKRKKSKKNVKPTINSYPARKFNKR